MAPQGVARSYSALARAASSDVHASAPPSGRVGGDAHTNLADFLLLAAQHEPDRVAIENDVTCYTYGQLAYMVASVQVVLRRALDRCEEVVAARAAPQPAPEFHRRRVDEHAVCIVLERGPECVAAVHATMLEGCVYNAFDVAEPREKLRTWVEIAQHPVMITAAPVMKRLGLQERGWEMGGAYPHFVIDVHQAISRGETRAHALPAPCQRPSDLDRLCYVIFTSGSTGKPKAVMIEHRSACNLVRVWSDFVGVRREDRLAQMASMAFDNHVPEVYGAMHKRCASVVVPDLMKRSGPDMVGWLAQRHVSVMVTVPSHLRSMLGPGVDISTKALPHLRVLDIGGEALGRDVLDAWAPGRFLFNIYGPTEVTVVCAGGRVKPGDEITIGGDLPTYRNCVLDPETLRECPIGTRGVLYIGGVGTGRGYLDDEVKTREKFVQVPGLGRMYCSGDVVSKDAQGRFHYHGRADWQVKVRGIRIELEALEEAIGNLPGVKHCEARVTGGGSKLVLIASGGALNEAEIKAAAAKLGKGYQLNLVKFVDQSAWKFNTSGKLVRNHVPLEDEGAGGQEAKAQDGWEAFRQEGAGELELVIARCVAQLVSAASWDRETHFIEELGLDSAGFGKLITLLRRQPDLQLVDLPMLFDSPTVASLAQALEARRSAQALEDADSEPLVPGQTGDALLDLLFGRVGAAGEPKVVHALCVQTHCQTFTYAQVLRRAVACQVLLRKALRGAAGAVPRRSKRPVLLWLEPGVNLLAALLAAVLERQAFCVGNPAQAKAGLLELAGALQPCAILLGPGPGAELSQQDLRTVVRAACPLVHVEAAALLAAKPQQAVRRPRSGAPHYCLTASPGTPGRWRLVGWQQAAVTWAARAWQGHLDLRPSDRVAQLFTPSLPESTTALLAALMAGACVLIPPEGMSAGSGLRTWLRQRRASVLGAAPPELRILGAVGGATSLVGLRTVWAAGPQCPSDVAVHWTQRGRHFAYLYAGPEVAAACAFDVPPHAQLELGVQLPLGQPLVGCRFLVLDQDRDPLPPGEEGLLFLASPGVAAGAVDEGAEADESVLEELRGGQLAAATGLPARQEANGAVVLSGMGRQFSNQSGLSLRARQTTTGLGGSLGRGSLESMRSTPFADQRHASLASLASFRGYLIEYDPSVPVGEFYGDDAALILCFFVQTLVILAEPFLGALGIVFAERILAPFTLYAEPWLAVLVLALATVAQQALQIVVAVLVKWLLIGRYTEGDHSIYSAYYLKHWLVERFASGSVLGGQNSQGGWNFGLGGNFLKVLALKMLGADVSFSSIVTAKVTGFDLVHIGPLASVHGPHTLTAVAYVGKRMALGRISIGQGATMCHGSSVSPGSSVADGAFVEPLSAVSSGTVARGRWSGVPGHQVAPRRRSAAPRKPSAQRGVPSDSSDESSDESNGEASSSSSDSSSGRSARQVRLLSDSDRSDSELSSFSADGAKEAGSEAEARRLALAGGLFAAAMLLLQLLQLLPLLLILWLTRFWVSSQDGEQWHEDMEVDALPPAIQDELAVLLLLSAGQALLQLLWTLLAPVLACRLLPRVRAPLDVPLYHWRAQVAALKLYQATHVSQELGDASFQACYLRLLGARVGRGSSMSEQTLLPDTLSIGKRCFFASGNTLTAVEVDQGRLRVPCATEIGDGCFLGNENHIAAGLGADTFVGLRTWVPEVPEAGGSLFGNPAMRFRRPAAAEGALEGSCCQRFWHHFSTSVVDVFLWRLLAGCTAGTAFILGRLAFPVYSRRWWPLQFLGEVAIFGLVRVLTWLLVPVGFCNLIYNDRMPLSAPYYSTVITRWFNANKIRRVFKKPFRTAGSPWDSRSYRLLGVKVGRRFFSASDDVMIDPPFGRLGDDVTIDYDGQVRQHSFEDDMLKWGPYYVGNGTKISQGAMVAMSECMNDVVLLRGSVTWKGQVLEPGTYEGAPAAPVDEEFHGAIS